MNWCEGYRIGGSESDLEIPLPLTLIRLFTCIEKRRETWYSSANCLIKLPGELHSRVERCRLPLMSKSLETKSKASVDRDNKDTLPLTALRSITKSSTEDFIPGKIWNYHSTYVTPTKARVVPRQRHGSFFTVLERKPEDSRPIDADSPWFNRTIPSVLEWILT